jgi:small subunit ribosomal protein S1
MALSQALAFSDEFFENTSDNKENFADLFEASYGAELAEGSVVTGTVIAIEKDIVLMDVGLKSEGRISLREFGQAGQNAELKVGDNFDVYIERIEDRNGEAQLSREKALREEGWTELERKMKNQERVEGIIFNRVKGGFTVDLSGAIAFLPGSQIDVRPIKDATPLMNVPQPFMILKMDRKRGNIVVSRRSVMEESRMEARNEMLEKIREGQILEGVVKNITDYGAFIDMGGLDGLLHVTDISWKRVSQPSEVLKIGDPVKVIVTKFDEKTKRISLGMKQLTNNPWEGVQDQFKVGARFKGKVSSIADYGVFVEVMEGIEGLVHVSEMSWTSKNTHPNKLVSLGDEVETIVLDVDLSKNRISLGMKQCQDNPWELFAKSSKVGDIIEGEVRSITDFGLFVGLANGIDGLVHHSDLSWVGNSDDVIKGFNKGDKIKAKILLIDVDKERVSLGIKQLEEAPEGVDVSASSASNASAGKAGGSKASKGQVITCTVTAVQKDGIEVKFGEDDTVVFIKRNDLSRDRQEQRPERFSAGDRVDAKVVSTDRKTGKPNLSIKALEQDEHNRAVAEYGSSDSGASLGAILGAALQEASGEDKKPSKAKK